MDAHDIDMFAEVFMADVESWFTAVIACCDACYDEFLSLWPHAYAADDAEFQKCSIDIDVFYSGSKRVQASYTKTEYDAYMQHMHCPRCGAQLLANIWPYCPPWGFDPAVERSIKEIAEIARETPFLLLAHDFAKRTYETILKVATGSTPARIESHLFRGRRRKNPVPRIPESFDFGEPGSGRENRKWP